MKKEMLVAVLIGFLLGLAITFGVYRVTVAGRRNVMQDVPVAPTPAATPDTDTLLVIHSPEDGMIQTSTKTTVTGTSPAGAHVVLFVNNTDYVRTSDDAGNFSFDVTLADGPNILTITMIDTSGATVTKQRSIIVTSIYEQAANPAAPASGSATSTESAKPSR